MTTKLRIALIASAALAGVALFATATAQPFAPGGAFMGPGMMSGSGMMGPWMMGRHGFGGTCNPAVTGFAEWRADRLAETLKLTDAQRPKFDEFKAASIKAAEAMRSACLAEMPTTVVGRMDAMEKRMDAMLQAIREVRPALEEFYGTLSDEQKSELDAGHGRFWRWRDRW